MYEFFQRLLRALTSGARDDDSDGGQRYPILARLLMIWHAFGPPLHRLTLASTALTNWLLRPDPRTDAPEPRRFRLWIGLSAGLLLLAAAFSASVVAFIVAALLGALHLAVAVSGFQALSEDMRVMDGYVNVNPREQIDNRRYAHAGLLKKREMFLCSLFFYVLASAVLLASLFHDDMLFLDRGQVFSRLWVHAQFFLRYLAALPGLDVLSSALSLPEMFPENWAAWLTLKLFYLLNFAVGLGGVTVILNRQEQMRRMMEALDDETPGRSTADIPFIQRRAAKAPSEFKRDMIHAALTGGSARTRRRATTVVRHMNAVSFMVPFLRRLHRETDEGVKRAGLKTCVEFLSNQDNDLGDAAERIRAALRAQRQAERGHSEQARALLEEIEGLLAEAARDDGAVTAEPPSPKTA